MLKIRYNDLSKQVFDFGGPIKCRFNNLLELDQNDYFFAIRKAISLHA